MAGLALGPAPQQMIRSLGDLRASFGAPSPPAPVHDAGPALEALWWQGKGGMWRWDGAAPCVEPHWEAAHRITQDPSKGGAARAAEARDPEVTAIHALLHAIEGDEVNAAGWYRAAGRAPPPGGLSDPAAAEAEWAALAEGVLERVAAAADAQTAAREASAAVRTSPRQITPLHTGVTNVLGSVSAAVVSVPGLTQQPLRVAHISDSHIDLGADDASGSAELCRFMSEAYAGGVKAAATRGVATEPLAAFEAQVAAAVSAGADLLIHTGDLLNFPSPKAAEHAAAVLEASGIPSLFVAGNHDWQHYPDTMPADSPEDLRAEWCDRALGSLYASDGGTVDHASHWCVQKGGLRIVAIDNSTNTITDDQLRFFRQSTAEPRPTVLLVHIPLYSESSMATLRSCA